MASSTSSSSTSSSSDSCGSDTDSESSSSSRSSTKSFSNKKFAVRRLRDMNYFFDKFGRCEKCQEIYWEMRHTRQISQHWYMSVGKGRGPRKIDLGRYIMREYRKKLLECPDCPVNKDTPCSLRDLAYSRISLIIGSIALTIQKKKTDCMKRSLNHDEYNRRVAKLPILDWMKKDLEAKPCKWECSHERYFSSTLFEPPS